MPHAFIVDFFKSVDLSLSPFQGCVAFDAVFLVWRWMPPLCHQTIVLFWSLKYVPWVQDAHSGKCLDLYVIQPLSSELLPWCATYASSAAVVRVRDLYSLLCHTAERRSGCRILCYVPFGSTGSAIICGSIKCPHLFICYTRNTFFPHRIQNAGHVINMKRIPAVVPFGRKE